MRISIKQLRRLISEVKLSPSLKTNKLIDSPLENKNIAELVGKLESAFSNALSLDLVVRAFDDHFNPETREFDDDVYEDIKQIVDAAKKKASTVVKDSLQSTWSNAQQSREPRSSVIPKKAA